MESVPGSLSEEQEVRSGGTLKEEEEDDGEEPRHVSATEELLLKLNLSPDQLYPESCRMNSPNESRLLDITDNFQRQYSHLYPNRKPLLLCPTNECGVKKFVSTTLRPTATEHPELFSWPGCASFVADFLSLEPLEPPVNLPSFLLSSGLVLQSQRATCLDFSTLLCSLLLGANYDAYCVSGYAVREMCLLDRSRLHCPLLDAQVKSEIHEQEPQQNKYSVKPPKELKSKFLIQQEEKKKKKQDEEAALLQKQKLQEEREQRPADPLHGLRVHCWVLVLSGSRGVPENFFIDPLTGNRHATDDDQFLGVESIWNNFNYYVNMQDCRNGCADMVYDLEDLKTWEPVLYRGTSKKQLMLDVLKKTKIMSKFIEDQEEEEEELRVFEMPRSWVSYINIPREALESRWPGHQKVTHYRRAKLEQFAPYVQSDGLVQRLTAYQDLDYTDEVSVKEWYQHRDDHLEEMEVNKLDNVTTERFTSGQAFQILFHRTRSDEDEREMLFSSGHRDDVVRRLVSPGEMTETFEGRSDFLFYRHVVGQRAVHFSGPYPIHQLNVRRLEKVVERFHRNRSKPANEDVAERVFLLADRRIEVTYHLEDHRTIGSKRSFIKPEKTTIAKTAENLRAQQLFGYQVDPPEKPFHSQTQNKMTLDLIKEEEKMVLQIKTSWVEASDFLASRAEEKRDVRLPFSPWTTSGASMAHSHRQEIERQAQEDQSWLQERKKDILAPLLIRLDNAETLSGKDAKQLYHDCLSECKQRMVEKANLIQKHDDKETQALQRKQQWYQENRQTITPQEEDEYQDYCSVKTLQIRVAKKHLSMHMEAAPLEYQNLDRRLKNDPRLAPHLLK